MEPIEGDIVPANTPVIIKCSSAYIEDNRIEPVIGGYDFEYSNWLGGVYCSLKAAKHNNLTLFDRITMRILGLTEDGELAFVAKPSLERLYKEQFLMANKAYLNVNANDADVMTLDGYTPDPQAINSVKSDEKSSTAIYTLTGIRLPDGVAPRAGIYVKNGKKVIIK
jgi:hypothetical protein